MLLLFSCQTMSMNKKANNFDDAQRLVDRIVAKHRNLVRLTIHAVPTGRSENIIIASNVPEKFGKVSDPEDIEVMETLKPVVLQEGSNLDVTRAILDKAGKPIASTGITLAPGSTASQQALLRETEGIAQELTDGTESAGHPFW